MKMSKLKRRLMHRDEFVSGLDFEGKNECLVLET